jgi:hypothetical protein
MCAQGESYSDVILGLATAESRQPRRSGLVMIGMMYVTDGEKAAV